MTNVHYRKYDFEYSTQFRKEYFWLLGHGFKPTYVKRSEDGVNTYKYKRTAKLFKALADFYQTEENERQFEALSKLTEAINRLPKDKEHVNPEDFEGVMTINPELLKQLFARS